MGFLRPNENTEKTHKMNVPRGQLPLIFRVNKIIYTRKNVEAKSFKTHAESQCEKMIKKAKN